MDAFPSMSAYDDPWNATQTFEHVRESYMASFIHTDGPLIIDEMVSVSTVSQQPLPKMPTANARSAAAKRAATLPRKRLSDLRNDEWRGFE